MRRIAKGAVSAIADLTLPFHLSADQLANRCFGRNRLVVIASHLYGNEPKDLVRRRLALLTKKFDFLPLSTALALLRESRLPPRSAAFTVDDATLGFATDGVRELVDSGIPFSVAVIPGLIDSATPDHTVARFMRVAGSFPRTLSEIQESWHKVFGSTRHFGSYDEVFSAVCALTPNAIDEWRRILRIPVESFAPWNSLRKLRDEAAVEFMSHSMSHPMMGVSSGAWLEWEVRQSKRLIELELSVSVNDFVFPVGEARDATAEVTQSLADAGYQHAFLVGYECIDRQSDRMRMRRAGFERPLGLLNLLTSKAVLNLV